MDPIKISEFTPSAPIVGTEVIPAVQTGGNVIVTVDQIATYSSKKVESPTSNLSVSGNFISLTAGINLVFGNICYMGSDGKMEKGNGASVATSFCWALALETILENASGLFALPNSIIRNDSWNWLSVGQPIYMDTSTSGAMTQTLPSGSGKIVQILGVATHPDRILFYPQLVQVEIL